MHLLLATTPQIIALIVGFFVFFLVVFVAVIKDEIDEKNARNKRPDNEWLFSNWDIKLYECLTKQEPEIALIKLGVDVEEYRKNCYIINKKGPDLKKLAARKYVGLLIILFSLPLIAISGFTNMSGIIMSLLIILIGYMVYMGDVNKIKKEAIEKKKQIASDLPRFLDLLQTALYVDIPVSDAIITTATHLKSTLIAKELISSIAESQMGSISWQGALQELAVVYDVDILSDFVQYLINGYEKGLNIYDVVSRQAEDARKTTLLYAEENANKLNTSIMLPIGLFKLFPLIAIVGYPVLNQMINGGTLF